MQTEERPIGGGEAWPAGQRVSRGVAHGQGRRGRHKADRQSRGRERWAVAHAASAAGLRLGGAGIVCVVLVGSLCACVLCVFVRARVWCPRRRRARAYRRVGQLKNREKKENRQSFRACGAPFCASGGCGALAPRILRHFFVFLTFWGVLFRLRHHDTPGSKWDIFFLLQKWRDLDELIPAVSVSQIVTRGKYFILKMRL